MSARRSHGHPGSLAARDIELVSSRIAPAVAALACALVGCGEPVQVGRRASGLEAYCVAQVIGVGAVDVETDYIPSVTNCENGAASEAALEAQAIAARSYLYYRLDLTGDIADGQSDQVYTCGRDPLPQHIAAAEATAGIILRYRDTQVAAFYVAGALQDPPACEGGTNDPTNTERFVTYNQGLSGDAIVQTTLGFVHPDNFANRGCMSQNGADCLSDQGVDHQDILRFYYGEDIEIVRATGPCVPAAPDAGPGGDSGVDVTADGGVDGGEPPGGCAVAGGSGASGWLALLAIAALVGRHGRRRRRRG